MKAKERESLKNLSFEELNNELTVSLRKKFDLSFKKASGAVNNPLEIRILRRRIAVIKTFIRQKEANNEQGSKQKK